MLSRRLSIIGLFAVVVSVVGLSGCDQSGPAGTYALDKEALRVAIQEEKARMDPNDPMAAMGAAMMEGMIDTMSMTMVINEDGTAIGSFSGMGESETANGTWTTSGNTITLSIASEGQEEPDTLSGTVDGDSLILNPPEDDPMEFSLVFRKQSS